MAESNLSQFENPYPAYRQMLAERPIYWDGNGWVFTRYADIMAALRDARLAAARLNPPEEWLRETGLGPLFNAHAKMMLFSDPPDHTRLRGLVNKAFTPRAVESMRTRIRQIVDGLIDQVEPVGRMDLIRDLAYPLPVTVIAEMLGVPPELRDQFKLWSEDIAAFIGGTTAPEMEMFQCALRSVQEMAAYFLGVAADRRTNPRDDLMSALALAEDQGDRLTEEELVANCILLLAAGHETTTNLIGNGMLALLRHPDQLQRLRDDPALIPNAVEELLRYDSPVQQTGRIAKVDINIQGYQIKAGQHILMVLGAANRDPAQFADPDRLDVGRREIRHLSFSHGAHFCLGAPLARLEGQIAFDALLGRLPGLRLDTDMIEWRDNYTLRGVRALPLAF